MCFKISLGLSHIFPPIFCRGEALSFLLAEIYGFPPPFGEVSRFDTAFDVFPVSVFIFLVNFIVEFFNIVLYIFDLGLLISWAMCSPEDVVSVYSHFFQLSAAWVTSVSRGRSVSLSGLRLVSSPSRSVVQF